MWNYAHVYLPKGTEFIFSVMTQNSWCGLFAEWSLSLCHLIFNWFVSSLTHSLFISAVLFFFLWHSHWCAPARTPYFYSSPNLSSTVKFGLVQLGESSWSRSVPDFLYCHIACSVLCSYGSHLELTSIALGFHFVVLHLWFCLYKTKGKLLMLSKIDCVAWGVQFSFRVLRIRILCSTFLSASPLFCTCFAGTVSIAITSSSFPGVL